MFKSVHRKMFVKMRASKFVFFWFDNVFLNSSDLGGSFLGSITELFYKGCFRFLC